MVATGRRGFEVAPVSIADLEDLTDGRVLIEREALRRSMERGDDAWEADLLAAYRRMDRMQDRSGEQCCLDPDRDGLHGGFHSALARACGSPVLMEMRQTLFDRARRHRRMSSQFRTAWRPKTIEHKAIMNAVLDRDPKAPDLIETRFRETTGNVVRFAGRLFGEDAAAPARAE